MNPPKAAPRKVTTSRRRGKATAKKPAVKSATAAKLELLTPGAVDLRDVRSRSEFVYSQLCDAISEGRFRQGMRLREEEIAQTLGVSRTPVREALRRLQARGLLTVGVGRSLIVSELTRQQVLELYAMREILEGSAARFAAQHASEAEIALLRHLHQQFLTHWGEPLKVIYYNRRFHQAIYECARNRYLTQALNEMHDAFALLYSNTFRVPERPRDSDAEHSEIIEAIAAHDPEAAERAARKHIRLAQQTRFE
jgi:DNA-binding GntR family transcriptional regulator